MIDVLTIVHVIVSVLLILLVLLQFGRGAEAGFFSDTSSSGVFTGPSKDNILVKITTVLAILFLGLAVVLANLRGKEANQSVFDNQPIPTTGLEKQTTEAAPASVIKQDESAPTTTTTQE